MKDGRHQVDFLDFWPVNILAINIKAFRSRLLLSYPLSFHFLSLYFFSMFLKLPGLLQNILSPNHGPWPFLIFLALSKLFLIAQLLEGRKEYTQQSRVNSLLRFLQVGKAKLFQVCTGWTVNHAIFWCMLPWNHDIYPLSSYFFASICLALFGHCSLFCDYRKVASSSTSRLEPHSGFFRFLMKEIFDPYVL